ncbi:hypothetical protein V8E55_006730 [Tylopilus felleus]
MNSFVEAAVRVPLFRVYIKCRTEASIRRTSIAEDGYDRLSDVDLRAPISIIFIDQIRRTPSVLIVLCSKGVLKEFFTSLCKEVFDADCGLWPANTKNEFIPTLIHMLRIATLRLNWYRFIGRVLGEALYEGIIDTWLGKQRFLASLDPDIYQELVFLKNHASNMEDLSLNFTAAVEEFGVIKVADLIPDGSNVPVTRENRPQYIYLISHYKLSNVFEGLSEIIDPKWLRMFNQQELQILLGGVNAPEPPVLESFDQEQRRAFLRFVTSCSRPPLLGFKQLNPYFAIRDAGSNERRLPTSSTSQGAVL